MSNRRKVERIETDENNNIFISQVSKKKTKPLRGRLRARKIKAKRVMRKLSRRKNRR